MLCGALASTCSAYTPRPAVWLADETCVTPHALDRAKGIRNNTTLSSLAHTGHAFSTQCQQCGCFNGEVGTLLCIDLYLGDLELGTRIGGLQGLKSIHTFSPGA